MSQLTFSQSERRSYLGPILIALAVLAAAAIGAWFYFPHHTADLAILQTNVVPTHTEIKSGSKLVGHQTESEDDLYVLTTLRIDDKLRDPLFLSDITASLVTSDGTAITTSAVEESDLSAVETAFPQIKSFATAPLLRESTIQPANHAQGMVMLHFPVTQAAWNNRKSATLTVTFYHQGAITIPIHKP
jgi:hypothetical protein